MFLFKSFISKLYLLSICWNAATPVPVMEPGDEIHARDNVTNIMKRGSGKTKADAIDATFTTDGWEDSAEEDCYIMLCIRNGERTYQKNPRPKMDKGQRTQSGAGLEPFQDYGITHRGTARINDETTSAEEFPWASTQQGGSGSVVMSTTIDEQRSQGGKIGRGWKTNGIDWNQWFTINFKQAKPFGPFCEALFKDPPDRSICPQKKKTNLFGQDIDLSEYAFQVIKGKKPFQFGHPSMGSGSGSGSKRSVETKDVDGQEVVDEEELV